MLSTLKKALAVVSMTVLAVTGLTATGSAAYADTTASAVAVQTLPFCYGISDTLGNGGEACIGNLTRTTTGYSNQETQVVYTGWVSTKVCYLGSCVYKQQPITRTGVGADQDQLVPRIETGSISVPVIVSTCVKTTCTPTSINVPTVKVTLLPPGTGPAITVCAIGSCPRTDGLIQTFEFDSARYVQLAAAD